MPAGVYANNNEIEVREYIMKMKLSLVAAGLALAANASAAQFSLDLGPRYSFFKADEIPAVKDKDGKETEAKVPGYSAGLTFATANAGVAFPVTDMVSLGFGIDAGMTLPVSNGVYDLKDGKFSTEDSQRIQDKTMSAWFAKPVVQVNVQPIDGLKLSAKGSFGQFGQMHTKMKEKDAEEMKLETYGMGFRKGFGVGVAANYQINDLVGVGLSYDMQTNTLAEVKEDTEKSIAAAKKQDITMHSVGFNVSFTI